MKSFERFIDKECLYRKLYHNEKTRAKVVSVECVVNGLGESKALFRLDNGDMVSPENAYFSDTA